MPFNRTITLHIAVFCLLIASSIAQHKNISNFADVQLNEEFLRGCRYFMEYKGLIRVLHAIDIVDISKVNVETMSIRVEFHLRQKWVARNLTFPEGLFMDSDANGSFVTAVEDVLKYVWSPDSYLPNARETKISEVSTVQASVRIRSNRTIIFASRMYAILGCAFNFQWYPMDKQTCDLVFESYSWTSDKVKYMWDPINPVTSSVLKLHQYQLQPWTHTQGESNRFGRGETYGYVKIQFVFGRQIAYHLIQVFTPTILIVILSWFSFWLDFDALPGRIGLLITCMLTLVTMHTGLKGDLPPVSYIKMLDIWMVSCMLFVFAALLEFVIVRYLQWSKKEKEEESKFEKEAKSKDINGKPPNGSVKNAWGDTHQIDSVLGRLTTGQLSAAYWRRKKTVKREIWQKVDITCRFVFPLAFVIFLICYWPMLFVGSAAQ